jgi:ribosomal protein S18 acetylase RimI-like enzyme
MVSAPRDADDIVLRRALATDVPALGALEADLFAFERLREADFATAIPSHRTDLIVADFEGRIAGYALATYRHGSNAGWLDSIGVATWGSGRGIGSALVTEIERLAVARERPILRLYVRADNAAAIALYTRLGYRQTSRKREFYADFCDALRMQRLLAP